MIRLVGAALVGLSCGWLGIKNARRLSERVEALETLDSALGQMERELAMRLSPLPQLMEELSAHTASPARELFAGCRTALDGLGRERFADAWTRLVEELPDLQAEDRRALVPLGQVLGRYDGAGQRETIAGTRRALGELRARAEEDSRRLGRVYRALGAAGGGFLIILLL